MADDPPPPPPHTSSKNEKLGVFMRGHDDVSYSDALPEIAVTNALGSTVPQLKNRSLFIEAMRDPLRRSIAFNVVERNCRERLRQGEDGINLYLQLFGYVRFANVPEAVDEFERRFVPMLDQELLKKKMKEAR